MSITVTVPQDDAVALQAAADMLNTIARSRLGLGPVAVGCGCKVETVLVDTGKETTVTHGTALGPITAHCLELAKEQNAADVAAVFGAGFDTPEMQAALAQDQAKLDAMVDPATVFAQAPLADRIVPHLSGSYTSPTGQLAGSAPLPPAAPPLAVGGVTANSADSPVTCAAAPRDRNGLPWDERVNTSNKAQTQQGVWKRKPGLTDEAYAAVIAELRTAQGASVAPAAAPPVEPSSPFINSANVEPSPNVPAPPVIPPAPAPAPPAPVVTPEPPAPATDDPAVPQTIAQLIPLVTQAINGGKITLEAVNAIIKDVTNGAIASMPILATRSDLIPSVYTHLKNAWSMA